MLQFTGLMRSGAITNLAIGLGVVVAVPLVAGILIPQLRPLARGTLKGGILAYEKLRETAAGIAETVEDVVAEVQQELHDAKHPELTHEPDVSSIEGDWEAEKVAAESGGNR